MIGGIDQQAVVAERLQNGGGLGRRLGRQFADRSLGLREFVVEKLCQRVVDRVGAGGACEDSEGEDPNCAQGAEMNSAAEIMSGETTGVRRRHDSPFNRGLDFGQLSSGGGARPNICAPTMGRVGAR